MPLIISEKRRGIRGFGARVRIRGWGLGLGVGVGVRGWELGSKFWGFGPRGEVLKKTWARKFEPNVFIYDFYLHLRIG